MKKSRRRSHHGGGPATEASAVATLPPPEPKRRRRSLREGSPAPDTAREPGLIGTDAGQYLRQAARGDAPSGLGTPALGAPAGGVDASARRVWEIAFGLMARRRFEPDTALAEISRTVATAVHEHAAAALPMLDAEMLVRAALGETVPVDEIDGTVLIGVHVLLFASLADELALGDAELETLIAEAEEKAAVRPPGSPGAA